MRCPHCQRSYDALARVCAYDGTPLVAEPSVLDGGILLPGSHVGDYVVEALIGEGGMGEIYRAVQPVIERRVAIKVLKASSKEALGRFVREARALSKLRHRNIVDVFTYGQLPGGRHYLVMDYLTGESLDHRLLRDTRLSPDVALPILHEIALTLDEVHSKGIAHRDLKPANIFVLDEDPGGSGVRLLDFGLARALGGEELLDASTLINSASGTVLGTPYYMPAECFGRTTPDYRRVDLYALGAVAYETLTGQRPYPARSLGELVAAVMYGSCPRPSSLNPALSNAVDEVLLKAIHRDPSLRYDCATAFLEALSAASRIQPESDHIISVQSRLDLTMDEAHELSFRQQLSHHEPPPVAPISSDTLALENTLVVPGNSDRQPILPAPLVEFSSQATSSHAATEGDAKADTPSKLLTGMQTPNRNVGPVLPANRAHNEAHTDREGLPPAAESAHSTPFRHTSTAPHQEVLPPARAQRSGWKPAVATALLVLLGVGYATTRPATRPIPQPIEDQAAHQAIATPAAITLAAAEPSPVSAFVAPSPVALPSSTPASSIPSSEVRLTPASPGVQATQPTSSTKAFAALSPTGRPATTLPPSPTHQAQQPHPRATAVNIESGSKPQTAASSTMPQSIGKIRIGSKLPLISGLSPDGTVPYNLNLILSKPRTRGSLVQLWASWCAPCKQELRQLQIGRSRLSNAGITVLLVNLLETPELVQQQSAELKLDDFPQILDEQGVIVNRLGLLEGRDAVQLPLSILTDSTGVVRAIFTSSSNHYVDQILRAHTDS